MKLRDIFLGLSLGFATATLAATDTTTNWLQEAIAVGLHQSTLVRHPVDSGKYYLCWTDGASQYGLAFRRAELDTRLKSMVRGQRIDVTSLMARSSRSGTVLPAWSSADEKICWPR